jgi:hypothetical protein
MKHTAPLPKTGVSCSACGARVVVSATLRGAKMQCPKCRAVIALPDPRMAGPIPEAGPAGESVGKAPTDRPEAARVEARLSTLEVRVALLEQELVSLKFARRAPSEPEAPAAPAAPPFEGQADPASRTAEVAWKRLPEIRAPWRGAGTIGAVCDGSRESGTEEPAPLFDNDRLDAAAEGRMIQTLAEFTGGKVAIRVKEGDAEAFHFGQWLGRVFVTAGWIVTTLETAPLLPEEQNLTLAMSGNFPFPRTVSAIQRALAAAGLRLAFGIDPVNKSPVPTLIVPRWPPEENDSSGSET